jgi:hypothetical protein
VLRPWLDDKLLSLGLHPARASLQPRGFGASFRTLEACREHFGFTVAGLLRAIDEKPASQADG